MNINSKERENTTNPLRQGCVHEAKKRQNLYVLNWKSSYDVMLLTCQNHLQHFAEF
jgi:hypothetical protein